MRIETLTKDKFETRRIQMKALLLKNDACIYVYVLYVYMYPCIYVLGSKPKPNIVEGDTESKDNCHKFIEVHGKAKADIILCVSPNELKQIKSFESSSDIWEKNDKKYQSIGPALKALLLKCLIQHRVFSFLYR